MGSPPAAVRHFIIAGILGKAAYHQSARAFKEEKIIMKALLPRSEADKRYTWALETIYANDELWEEHYLKLEKAVAAFAENKGKIAADIGQISTVLDDYYAIERGLEKLAVYAYMRSDQDTGDGKYLKMKSKAGDLEVKAQSEAAFIEPEILGHGEEALKAALDEDDTLEFYRRKIEEMLRGNEHTLSAELEAVLADSRNMADAASEVFNVLINADMKFPDAVLDDGRSLPVSNSTYISYMESPEREIRKKVFESYYGQFAQFENTLAALYSANLKQAQFYAKRRKYSSARAMYLDGSNIPESVYDNLIDAVHEALPDMYRYVSIRKKVLGVNELHMYDVYTPIFSASSKSYSFETGKQMVLEALKPMGEEYVSHIKEGLDNRWIDVYPNLGKRSGAYSWGCYDSQPFVLMNYVENLDSVFTLIHELGHSMHSYYSKHNQKYAYAGYKIFVAEVASTCNESLLMHDLLAKTTDKEERKFLLNHYLDSFKGTIFRQTMFAEFEKITHDMAGKGQPLTADVLNELYLELNKKYFGPDMVSDDDISREWMRVPHFYTPFYVYQYATGYSAAIALSTKILKEGRPAVDQYLKFLKGGCSMDPIDLLKLAGVDMTTPQPVAEALKLFGQLVDELESLI